MKVLLRDRDTVLGTHRTSHLAAAVWFPTAAAVGEVRAARTDELPAGCAAGQS